MKSLSHEINKLIQTISQRELSSNPFVKKRIRDLLRSIELDSKPYKGINRRNKDLKFLERSILK
jgi:Txe/YoeB family toxin of Txe-Axe toxin-antitoxin module